MATLLDARRLFLSPTLALLVLGPAPAAHATRGGKAKGVPAGATRPAAPVDPAEPRMTPEAAEVALGKTLSFSAEGLRGPGHRLDFRSSAGGPGDKRKDRPWAAPAAGAKRPRLDPDLLRGPEPAAANRFWIPELEANYLLLQGRMPESQRRLLRWHWSLEGPGQVDIWGRYTAPASIPPGGASATLWASCRFDPERRAKAVIRILPGPDQPAAPAVESKGQPAPVRPDGDVEMTPAKPAPAAGILPFFDLTTGQRVAPVTEALSWDLPWEGKLAWPMGQATVGEKLTLSWNPPPEAQAVRLSFWDGRQTCSELVTGKASLTFTPQRLTGVLHLEALKPDPQRAGVWHSSRWSQAFALRGLGHHAGADAAPKGHRDGPDAAARFHDPSNAAWIQPHGQGEQPRGFLLVADGNLLRTVRRSDRGQVVVATLCGDDKAFQGGHVDGKLQDARFLGPTFLAPRPVEAKASPGSWACAVADTRNHCVRLLRDGAEVTTLAGTATVAGYLEGEHPLFDRPYGMAWDRAGHCYVADGGNGVIRRIRPDGHTELVAGGPGQGGHRDGTLLKARFDQLKGLCIPDYQGPQPILYALDGHAVREIDLNDGTVTTFAGQVLASGFGDVTLNEPEARREALTKKPCFKDPWAIVDLGDGQLAVSDTGNHALRFLDVRNHRLTTRAGDPDQPRTWYGCPRPGEPDWPLERYAALKEPTALAVLPAETIGSITFAGGLIVSSGRVLGQFHW
jgi:hypothetical protein